MEYYDELGDAFRSDGFIIYDEEKELLSLTLRGMETAILAERMFKDGMNLLEIEEALGVPQSTDPEEAGIGLRMIVAIATGTGLYENFENMLALADEIDSIEVEDIDEIMEPPIDGIGTGGIE